MSTFTYRTEAKLQHDNHIGILGHVKNLADTPLDQQIDLIEPVVHSGWNSKTFLNDIAMIKLSKHITIGSNIQIIQLASSRHDGETATVAGFGANDPAGEEYEHTLKYIKQKILDVKTCQDYPPIFEGAVIDNTNLCAKSLVNGESTCLGDSGSPLVVKSGGQNVQVGLVSYGTLQCDGSQPDIYTYVGTLAHGLNKDFKIFFCFGL